MQGKLIRKMGKLEKKLREKDSQIGEMKEEVDILS